MIINSNEFNKGRRFFLHYNKPESQRKKRNLMSVHIDKQCIIVDEIKVNVPTETKHNKRQPHIVMRGFAKKFRVEEDNDRATIYLD